MENLVQHKAEVSELVNKLDVLLNQFPNTSREKECVRENWAVAIFWLNRLYARLEQEAAQVAQAVESKEPVFEEIPEKEAKTIIQKKKKK